MPLGVAARALDELRALAATTTRFGHGEPLLHEQRFQDGFAAAWTGLAAARAYLYEQTGEVWRSAYDGQVTPTAQAGASVAMGVVAQAATHAVRFAHEAAGTASIRADSVLYRCLNDVTVATRHVAFSPFARQNANRSLLGLSPRR